MSCQVESKFDSRLQLVALQFRILDLQLITNAYLTSRILVSVIIFRLDMDNEVYIGYSLELV